MVCSAAERMLDWGALTTMTPRRVAAATSTLSSPMPARPTTTRSESGFQHVGGHLGGGADDERRRPGDGGQQLRPGQADRHVDLVAGSPQQGQSRLGDLLGYQDPRHVSLRRAWPAG